MNNTIDVDDFKEDFLSKLRSSNAAIFAGAGLSRSSGYVDWQELIRPLAKELKLDIEKESDLIAIAQYHYNENGNNRHRINEVLLEKIAEEKHPSDRHLTLARLPVDTYWTTNYDSLIEDALKQSGKIPDVKYVVGQLATTTPRRDAVVYKMHGDKLHPNEAVLIKDDYESYELKKGHFITALAGDLVSKTFLFLGLSFTDPNLDYVLSHIRTRLKNATRRHYCILKKREKHKDETEDDFRQAAIKQALAINDLKRFNIRTVLIDSFGEIDEILEDIERRYLERSIFISGSAEEYGDWGEGEASDFLAQLSSALVDQDYRIVTGLGKGIGNPIISGGIDKIYSDENKSMDDHLLIRPFPRHEKTGDNIQELWEEYRQDLVKNAGICLILFGNKLTDDGIANAQGVYREFELAREQGLIPIPVGSTGYMAHEIWKEVYGDLEHYFPNGSAELSESFRKLGEDVDRPDQIISAILEFLDLIKKR